jgi:hypothetical protein
LQAGRNSAAAAAPSNGASPEKNQKSLSKMGHKSSNNKKWVMNWGMAKL